jgi:lysophospholipase L1-like esterase
VSSACLLPVYYLYQKGYAKYHAVLQQNLDEVMKGVKNYNVLFVGSSRTLVHVNPKAVDSATGWDSYNAGIDGANLLEINLVLQCFLKKHMAPQLVVLELSTNAFDIERRPFFSPLKYYSYLDDSLVYRTLKPYKRAALLKYLPFTQLTEADDYSKTDALYGWLGKREVLKGDVYKGFEENGDDTITLPFHSGFDTSFYQITNKGKEILNEIISLCNQRNIKLVFTYAPEFYLIRKNLNPQFFQTIANSSIRNNIPFLDYRNCFICRNHQLFANPGHLNKKGAAVYSQLLAQDLKNIVGSKISTANNLE